MGLQLLFCVETNKKTRTDWTYISVTIKKHYEINNAISLKPIFMEGKCNYKGTSVVNQIRDAVKEFKYSGNTVVIYCIDTDDWDRDPDRRRELNEIQAYCDANRYDLVWFCRNVEEVFWGKQVPASDKVAYARRFNKSNRINAISVVDLQQQEIAITKSNMLTVLNKYLKKKE